MSGDIHKRGMNKSTLQLSRKIAIGRNGGGKAREAAINQPGEENLIMKGT